MQYNRLDPDLPQSSALAFGCGSMLGRVGRRQSLRAIAQALDAGITHFDIARSYGYGEAEALLGEALKGARRDRVVIATKLGLAPPRAASWLRPLKPLARALIAATPGLRGTIRRGLAQRAPAERFSPGEARASFEQSLRALGVDHVDILFLHDCTPEAVTPELVDFLDRVRAEGKLRRYGVATGIDSVLAVAARHGAGMLYQFANGLMARNLGRFTEAATALTHSPFQGGDALAARLQSRAQALRALGRETLRPGDLHHAMLAYALAANARGAVICSMLRDDHLRQNLAVVERPIFDRAQIAAFAEAVEAE